MGPAHLHSAGPSQIGASPRATRPEDHTAMRPTRVTCTPTAITTIPADLHRVHTKTLMACVELGRTLSCKLNPEAFLFKAIKDS
jgi:hypothetical protein